MPNACSPDGRLMNDLEHTQSCECTVSDCDGLTCGAFVSTIAQDHSVKTNHTVEEAAGGCVDGCTGSAEGPPLK